VALPGAPGSPPDDQRPRARRYLATIGDALPHRPPLSAPCQHLV